MESNAPFSEVSNPLRKALTAIPAHLCNKGPKQARPDQDHGTPPDLSFVKAGGNVSGWAFVLSIAAALGITMLLAVPLYSDTQAAAPVEPTGCTEPTSQVKIKASTNWGVVPFAVDFEVILDPEGESEILWDFENDGIVDATGIKVTHTFTQPIDYAVRVTIHLGDGRTLTRRVAVSGYTGVLTLTFDDGSSSLYEYALPLLESKNVTATAYVVPTWLEKPGYLTWNELHALQAAGWDIGSHSMTHPRLTEISGDSLMKELTLSKEILEKMGFPVKHFAVPYSAYNDTVIDSVRHYYESCRLGDDALNRFPILMNRCFLKSYCSQDYWLLNHYRQYIDAAADDGLWYILNNHVVADTCYGLWCIETSMLSDIIDYAVGKRLKVANIDEVLTNPACRSRIRPRDLAGESLASRQDNGLEVHGWKASSDYLPRTLSCKRLSDRGMVLELPETLSAQSVRSARLYDIMGRFICSLRPIQDGMSNALLLDLSTLEGGSSRISSGIYFCQIKTRQRSLVVKIGVVK